MKYKILSSEDYKATKEKTSRELFLEDLAKFIKDHNILDSSHQLHYSSSKEHYSVMIIWK